VLLRDGHSAFGLRRSAAFTLMELLVLMTVLVIAAAAIFPNVVAYEQSQKAKKLEASILRFPLDAKDEAVKAQMPVRIRVDGNTLVMERMPLDFTGQQQPQMVKQLDLGDTVQVENTQAASNTATDTSWEWTTYPDGSSDQAGIQFSFGSVEKSLVLPAVGDPQWTTGVLPDQTQVKWQAGQLSIRSSS
jgi:type II secretory pathway pseudopilin PulG